MNQYQQYIALSRYARWLPEENRRETWKETVNRYMTNVVKDKVDKVTYKALEETASEILRLLTIRKNNIFTKK